MFPRNVVPLAAVESLRNISMKSCMFRTEISMEISLEYRCEHKGCFVKIRGNIAEHCQRCSFTLAPLGTVFAGNRCSARLTISDASFRHDSIPTAILALQSQSPKYNVLFEATEDNTFFTQSNLSNYDAILFLSTTDSNATPRVEVLNANEKVAFQQYLALGGNYIGIHSSSDSLTETPFFGNESGAYFDYHPALTNATIVVLNSSNPSTSPLPSRWPVQDEMYNFKSDPRSLGAFVLLSVDESTYTDTGTRTYNQGTPHPIAWAQEHGAGALMGGASPPATGVGRSWYTSLGHLNETWKDPLFLSHVMGGIQWALESGSTRAFSTQASVGNANSTTTSVSSSRTATVGGSSLRSGSTPSSTSSRTSNAGKRATPFWWKWEL